MRKDIGASLGVALIVFSLLGNSRIPGGPYVRIVSFPPICALAPAPANFPHTPDKSDYNSPTRDAFLQEYAWIMDLLIRTYPDHEFLFVWQNYHRIHPGEGWEELPIRWRGHLIYKRPLTEALKEAA